MAGLGPAIYLGWAAYYGHLSANPLSDITNETGVWTLRFLCITLLLTPFRRVTGLNLVSPFRRMTGLYAFFYGTLHFSTYLILDRFAGLVDYPGGMISFTTAKRVAGVVHYWWLVKADISRPQTYAAIVAVLLAARVYYQFKKNRPSVRPSASPSASTLDRQSARG